jgi:hypothetical protein
MIEISVPGSRILDSIPNVPGLLHVDIDVDTEEG